MIKYACNPPHISAEAITREGLPKLGYPTRESPLGEFDVEISSNMSVIPARVLDPPRIKYHSEQFRVIIMAAGTSSARSFIKPRRSVTLLFWVLPDGGDDDFRGQEWDAHCKPILNKVHGLRQHDGGFSRRIEQ